MLFTVCRIILLLLPLLSGWQPTRNVWFGASKLPTSTLIYFCLETSASSTIKIFLSQSNSWIYSSFWNANLATHARAAVSKGNTFSIVANKDFKYGWFSSWSGISAAKSEETACSLKFTWSSCKEICLLWDLLFSPIFLVVTCFFGGFPQKTFCRIWLKRRKCCIASRRQELPENSSWIFLGKFALRSP